MTKQIEVLAALIEEHHRDRDFGCACGWPSPDPDCLDSRAWAVHLAEVVTEFFETTVGARVVRPPQEFVDWLRATARRTWRTRPMADGSAYCPECGAASQMIGWSVVGHDESWCSRACAEAAVDSRRSE
jgi:hypothetical protein